MPKDTGQTEEVPPLPELFSPKILQEIEDAFTDLAGFRVLLCDPSLKALFDEMGGPTFCRVLEESLPEVCASCRGAALAASPVVPGMRRCPAGPVFMVVPVDRGGIRFGALLLGPVLTGKEELEAVDAFARETGLDKEILHGIAAGLPVVDPSRLEGAGRLVGGFARALGDTLVGALSTRWEETRLWDKFKALEEELVLSKDFLESIFHGVPAIISVTDLNGIYTSWPPYNEEYFGYKAEEMVGKVNGATLLAEPEYGLEIRDLMEEKGFFEGEVILVKKDGTHALNRFTVRNQLDREGRHIGYIGVGVDISNQKEMEERLRLSEERTRALLETLPDL
ncbi:MAG: PocR ligand-binding domain-containing protein, partial [Planctomycetota bacterium]